MAVAAQHDEFKFLTRQKAYVLPLPPPMRNHGNLIVSLGQLTAWLGQQAETLGVEIFPGFAATAPLYSQSGDDEGAVCGMQVGDMGLNKDGSEGPNYTPGIRFLAGTTCWPKVPGSASRRSNVRLVRANRRHLDWSKSCGNCPGPRQTWPDSTQRRLAAGLKTYGGSFLYHWIRTACVGYVVGLDYQIRACRRSKHFNNSNITVDHRCWKAARLAAGARTIAAGGWQSLPKLDMPGALLLSDAGGTECAKIKGIHQAIRSGMCAAEHLAETGKVGVSCAGAPHRGRTVQMRNIAGFQTASGGDCSTAHWKPSPRTHTLDLEKPTGCNAAEAARSLHQP
jgi:electron-transferring-flavoprotein dehydrogenase